MATARGKGWVREVWQGAPIVTGDRDEAQRWATRRAALDAARLIARGGRLPLRLVELDGVQRLRGE